MTSWTWRFGITLAFIGSTSIRPPAVGAQPPVYLTQWGSYGSGNGEFNNPIGVATDAAGNVYVAELANQRVQKFTGTGAYITQWGSFGSGNGQFFSPDGVATDAAGNVYVVDRGNDRIQKFTATGDYLTQWGSNGSGDGQFDGPLRVATDASGDVYVVDLRNNRIQEFTDTGVYLTQWGSYGSGDGQFFNPSGVATDAAGDIYVTDQGNQRIQKFGPSPTPPLEVAFDLAPGTIDLRARGLWITGFLEPSPPLAAGDIDVSSIRLNGTVAVDPTAPVALGDHDADGIPDLMVKFDRAAVERTLSEGGNVAVVVTGTIGSASFSGSDNVRVIRAAVSAPMAGSHVTAGSVTQVRWETPSDITIESVALLHSLDGGMSWSLIARGQPNTGSYDWTVPNVRADEAKVAVVLAEASDETGDIVDGVLGVSGPFSIDAAAGVGELGPARLELRGASPNPVLEELRVRFSLADDSPATVALFDVSGRQLAARRADGMRPGWHTVALGGPSRLPAGLYVIRLTQEGRSLTARAIVVR